MIKIAILGAGIGRAHLAALREQEDVFQVVAVADQDLTRIEEIRNGGTLRPFQILLTPSPIR